MTAKGKGKQGEELFAYLPRGTIQKIDEVRGQYFTHSKFVLWALDKAIAEASSGTMSFEWNNKENVPAGANVGSRALAGEESVASNTEELTNHAR